MAWRVNKMKPLKQQRRELSLPLREPENAVGNAFMLADWNGGETTEVQQITVAQYREILSRSRAERAPLWEGMHLATTHKLEIRQRADRFLLLSMTEQGKQILQVRVDRFGDAAEIGNNRQTVENDNAAVQRALAFMKPLAEEYASGKTASVADLKTARDEKFMRSARTPAEGPKTNKPQSKKPKTEVPKSETPVKKPKTEQPQTKEAVKTEGTKTEKPVKKPKREKPVKNTPQVPAGSGAEEANVGSAGPSVVNQVWIRAPLPPSTSLIEQWNASNTVWHVV